MYDCFINRLSKSQYKDCFIIKGGFYLSTLFGIDTRSTMDIDTAIFNAEFSEENVIKMIDEIIYIDVGDNVVFEIYKKEQIRDEDEYGGLRITIKFYFDTIRDSFHIDVATGDPIYPCPYIYEYKSLVGEEVYHICSCSMETVLSEKIETILSRLETNGRMKDYYDIYLIYTFYFEKMNKDYFRKAVEKTFYRRKFNEDLVECLDIIKNSVILQTRWHAYSRKNNYANHIIFQDTIRC